jgi:hypothetical protein
MPQRGKEWFMPENRLRSELQKLPDRQLAEINASPLPSTPKDLFALIVSPELFPLTPRFRACGNNCELIANPPPVTD